MGIGPRGVQHHQTKTGSLGTGKNGQLCYLNYHKANKGRHESHPLGPRGSKGVRKGKPNQGPKHVSQVKGQHIGTGKQVAQSRLRGKNGRANQKPSYRLCGAVRGRSSVPRCVGTTPNSSVGHQFGPTRGRSEAHSFAVSSPSSSNSGEEVRQRGSRNGCKSFEQTVSI